MIRAYEAYRFKKDWQKLEIRAMKQDFSWDKSAQKYIEMYQQIIPFQETVKVEKP